MNFKKTPAAAFADKPYVAIPMAPVESNQVKAIGYDAERNTLAVTFTRGPGHIYHYPGVGPNVHADFIAAESKGAFFGSFIKAMPFEKFPAPAPEVERKRADDTEGGETD